MQKLGYKLDIVPQLQNHAVPHTANQNDALRLGSPLSWKPTMDYVTKIPIQFTHKCNN